MRKLLASIAQLRDQFAKFLDSLPFWADVVRFATALTAPVVRFCEWVLRVAPFLKKVDWLFEIQLLTRRHPVVLALSMGYMLWRGLHTTPLGHIGTDRAIYPFLAVVSGYNPFLGIVCALVFGAGDIIQKLFVPDMFGTHGWGDLNYWGAICGYILAYSSVAWMGWCPGAASRAARYGVRSALRKVLDKRAAATADGAGPRNPAANPAVFAPPPDLSNFELLMENLAAFAAAAIAAYVTMVHVAPVAETPAFDLRPVPDHSCKNLENRLLGEQSGNAAGGALLGSAAPVLAGHGTSPGGSSGGGSGQPSGTGPSTSDGSNDTREAIQNWRNSYAANQHDYNQAQQNLEEAQKRLNSLPPDQRAVLAGNPDFQSELQHYRDEMTDAQRSMDGYRNNLANAGASPDGGVDPQQEYTRGGASAHADQDLDNARWKQAADRYEKSAVNAANRSGHEGDLFNNPNYQVFDPKTGAFDPDAWARLQEAQRAMHRAEQLVHEGHAENLDASLEQAINMARTMRDTGQAAATMIFPANSLAGMGVNFGYGAMSSGSEGHSIGDAAIAGAESAGANLLFHYGFELGGKALGAAGRWAGILPTEPIVPDIGKIDPNGPRVYTDAPSFPEREVVPTDGPRPYTDAPMPESGMSGPPERGPGSTSPESSVGRAVEDEMAGKGVGKPNEAFKNLKTADEKLTEANQKLRDAQRGGDPDAVSRARAEMQEASRKQFEAQRNYEQSDPRRAYRKAEGARTSAWEDAKTTADAHDSTLEDYRRAKAEVEGKPNDPVLQQNAEELRQAVDKARRAAEEAQEAAVKASEDARDAANRLRQHLEQEGNITAKADAAIQKEYNTAGNSDRGGMRVVADSDELRFQQKDLARAYNDWHNLKPGDPGYVDPIKIKPKADGVLGFNERSTGRSVSMKDPGVIVHERLHANTSEGWKSTFADNKSLNEGMTNHLAIELGENSAAAKPGFGDEIGSAYMDEVAAVKNLESIVGKDAMRDAYFHGNTDALIEKVGFAAGASDSEMAMTHGKRVLDQINEHLKDMKTGWNSSDFNAMSEAQRKLDSTFRLLGKKP